MLRVQKSIKMLRKFAREIIDTPKKFKNAIQNTQLSIKLLPYPLVEAHRHTMVQHDNHVHPLVNVSQRKVRDMTDANNNHKRAINIFQRVDPSTLMNNLPKVKLLHWNYT